MSSTTKKSISKGYRSQTFSADKKTMDILNKLIRKTNISKSRLLRMFIEYFNKNPEEINKIIKEEYK